MLGNSMVMAMVAVSDIDASKEFYGETLGLNEEEQNAGGIMYESGGGKLFVYPSGTAGKNEATSATWAVDDVPAMVEKLKDKGITFERYDMPGATLEGDVYSMGSMQTAWFKDPDGNILAISSL